MEVSSFIILYFLFCSVIFYHTGDPVIRFRSIFDVEQNLMHYPSVFNGL